MLNAADLMALEIELRKVILNPIVGEGVGGVLSVPIIFFIFLMHSEWRNSLATNIS